MFRRFSANFALFSIAMDAALVALALLLSTLLRPLLSALPVRGTHPFSAEHSAGIVPGVSHHLGGCVDALFRL
jgi:hypothetical protein